MDIIQKNIFLSKVLGSVNVLLCKSLVQPIREIRMCAMLHVATDICYIAFHAERTQEHILATDVHVIWWGTLDSYRMCHRHNLANNNE